MIYNGLSAVTYQMSGTVSAVILCFAATVNGGIILLFHLQINDEDMATFYFVSG